MAATIYQTCDRPGCPGRPAVSYCTTCGEKLCNCHKRAHDNFHERGHTVIPIADYDKAPGRFQKKYCDQHVDKEVVMACRHCDRQICCKCDTHTGLCIENKIRHDFDTLQALEEETTSHYLSLEHKINDKQSRLSVLDQQALQTLRAEEKKCENWIREIERVRDRKIREIQELMEEGELMKVMVHSHQHQLKEEITSYRTRLAEEKDALRKECSVATDLLEHGNVSTLIRRKRDVTRSINNQVHRFVNELRLSAQPTLLIQGETVSLGVELYFPPASLTHLHSTNQFNGVCYSAYHRADGNILIGTNEGVKLINKTSMAVTSYSTPFKIVTSVVEHHGFVYILHRKGDVCEVVIGPPDMKCWQALFKFTNKTTIGASMTVSSKYVVVMNPGDETVIIYDVISQKVKVKQPAQRIHPYFLPDGHLLAKNGPKLSKYRLEDGELTEMWTCDVPKNMFSVMADHVGLLYGLAWDQKSLYVVSPDGKLLHTIWNGRLPIGAGHASIRGGEIAIPGWKDKRLHLYRINR